MHPEKGFTLKESNYIDFMARIRQVAETLNWELFCEKRPSMDEELVHEFYVTLTSSELTEVSIHRIKQRVEKSEDPKEEEEEEEEEKEEEEEEEEEDPTEIEPIQSVEIPDKAKPVEPEAK
ncbi:hypothetical protein PVK06_005247 [Gossypium arboreum]|uniref:Uncharacterized protein n=1 Tax=Gossypium arboreum TaxID=29729 RepID=A0ABR0QU46_GOSAR|nr:hypothetical protein PVK06_005247 [Gossypium arboreum]